MIASHDYRENHSNRRIEYIVFSCNLPILYSSVIFLGTGKTSLAKRYVDGTFRDKYISSVTYDRMYINLQKKL